MLPVRDPDDPIRLDEARLAAWAQALGQGRAGDGAQRRPHRGALPDVDFSRAERAPSRPSLLKRLLLAFRRGTAGAPIRPAGGEMSGTRSAALGGASRTSYLARSVVEHRFEPGSPAGNRPRGRAL
jgi:hypothetical protein